MVAPTKISANDATAFGRFLHADKWTGRYQRNNKRSGLKNLRCFPFCSDTHRLRGFCGREVKFATSNAGREKLYSWAEFRKLEDHRKGPSGLRVGEVISAQEARNRTRTKKEPFKPWYAGEPSHGDSSRVSESVVFEYNKSRKGWNYGWVANKHTCDSVHILRAYICAQLADGSFQCRGIFDSPGFTLFCRRRQRQNVVDLPAHLKVQLETEEAERKRKSSPCEVETVALSGLASVKRRCGGLDDSCCTDSLSSGSFDSEGGNVTDSMSVSSPSSSDLEKKKRDNILWRIMHALLLMDFDERSSTQTDAASTSGDSLLDALESVPSTSPDSEEARLDELLETYFTPGTKDPLGLDPLPLESDLEPLGVDMSDLDSGDWFSKESVLEELAQFMVDENNFTRAIEEVLGGKTVKDLSVEEKKRMLLDAFTEQLEVFLDKFSMTLEDFDVLLSPPPVATDSPVGEKVSSQVSLYSSVKPCRPAELKNERLAKLSGKWRRSPETLENMESIWQMFGIPWLIRKALGRLEKDFEINLAKHLLEYRVPKKLMFNGVVQFKLDGRVHPLMASPILPLPGFNIFGSKDMSFKPTCCAFVDGERVVLINTFKVNMRICRTVDVSTDGTKLHSTIAVQTQKSPSDWVTEGSWQGVAERIG